MYIVHGTRCHVYIVQGTTCHMYIVQGTRCHMYVHWTITIPLLTSSDFSVSDHLAFNLVFSSSAALSFSSSSFN